MRMDAVNFTPYVLGALIGTGWVMAGFTFLKTLGAI